MKPTKSRPIAIAVMVFCFVIAADLVASDYVYSTALHFRILRALIFAALIGALTLHRSHLAWLKTDFLTGTSVRLVAEQKLTELGFAGRDVTIAIIDINGLKIVNDTLGHPEGDKVLKEVGHRLVNQFGLLKGRRTVVARIGGDEFMVLAEHISKRVLIKDLSECLAHNPYGDGCIASAGVARSKDGRIREARWGADRALYRAKNSLSRVALGYNIEVDGEPPPGWLNERPKNRFRDREGRIRRV